mmetsp:Transcript_28356/g.41718  ORF Transcript_28356/g.41718 Transcript_28356/m.41718 type:complete len:85 (-) Transcript_28356:879-1133(-)
MAVQRNSGFSWNRKGESATDANNIRAEVAALAGNESFINRPKGKLVPYKTEQINNNTRGQRNANDNPGSTALSFGTQFKSSSLS